ncbi:uncharacterized protein AMSG_07381 [Thecamonas trahens ATCC 50062]|uniref:Chitin-binding type-4 domain-containing protein n=1 Tax=Thecamonas trahens ATCC 50062 TaxID=461836 RepID=A0A0L0DGP7_THETB|nr:hypothetical protein AMSG_07381 [Thecamonas trahens ATCC 50062]KNC51365.1 hypothetical protein AMSG_07381 [Thecamonas trahens ATCC 50062]|eukprot:XP_013756283.1 hypothetical protein AMSG_07381 [Thecamonas trahens ATCC 50062]
MCSHPSQLTLINKNSRGSMNMGTSTVLVTLSMVLVMASLASGHICALHPVQRGGANVSIPGDPSCYKRTAPCGATSHGPPSATYAPGSIVEVNFQQALNHWYYEKPGHLDVAIASGNSPSDSAFTVIGTLPDFPAHDQVWQTNFTMSVTIPASMSPGAAVMRFRYVANNPDEAVKGNPDAIFYNCADVLISAAAGKTQAPAADARLAELLADGQPLASTATPTGCEAPKQFEGVSIQAEGTGAILRRAYAYDAVNQRVFVDRRGTIASDSNIVREATWTDYHAMKQWVLFEYADSTPSVCELYGPDAFYAWTYGDKPESAGQTFEEQVPVGASLANVWSNGVFWWASEAESCLPVWKYHLNGAMELFTNTSIGIADPSVFDIPSICNGLVQMKRCS